MIDHFRENDAGSPESQKLWESLQEIVLDVDAQKLAPVRKQVIELQHIERRTYSSFPSLVETAKRDFESIFPTVSSAVDTLLMEGLDI